MTDAAHRPTKEQEFNLTQEQRMAYLRQGSDFEPDRDLKATWLPLRKTSPRKWGGIEYPGLFDYKADQDAFWFYVTVFFEVISALAIALLFLMSNRDIEMWLALVAVILNLLLDGSFAYIHHLGEREYCIQKNRALRFLPEGWKAGIGSYAQHALSVEMEFKSTAKVWFLKPVGITLIWAYALAKILIFLALYLSSDFYYELMEEQNAGLIAIGLAVLAIVMYIWVAVNHTYRTGYYLAYCWHRLQCEWAFSKNTRAVGKGAVLNNEKSTTIKQNYQAQSRTKTIELDSFCRLVSQVDVPEFRYFQQQGRVNDTVKQCLKSGLVEQEVDGLHSLVKVQGRENTWKLTCHGLFKDEQLDKIVKIQPTDLAKLAVAYYGHSIQMDSINL